MVKHGETWQKWLHELAGNKPLLLKIHWLLLQKNTQLFMAHQPGGHTSPWAALRALWSSIWASEHLVAGRSNDEHNLHVCMYVYISIYMYMYMCTCIYIYTHISICICIYIYILCNQQTWKAFTRRM